MIELSGAGWLIVGTVALLVGVSKTAVPGVGVLGVVLMVFAVGPGKASGSVGLLLPLLIVGDVFAVAWYRRHALWRHLVKLLPAAVVGILIGFALAHLLAGWGPGAPGQGRIIGGIVLALMGLNRWRIWAGGENAPVPRHWGFAVAIGVAAGITTMLANAAGPLMVIYCVAMRLDKHAWIGTSAWYYFLLNSFKVPFMVHLGWITADSLKVGLLAAPLVVVGAVAGVLIFRRIPEKVFAVAVELLAAVAAAKLLIG